MLRETLLACSLCLFACAERPVPTGPPPAWMERAVYDQVAPFGPHQLLGGIFRGITLDEDRGLRWQVQLERDRCYAFSAVGSEAVEELRLEIWDPAGQRLFTTTSKQRAFKGFCVDGRVYQIEPGRRYYASSGFGYGHLRSVPPRLAQAQPGVYEFELKTTEGYGHVELGVFVATGYAPPPPPAQVPPPQAPPPSAPAP